MAKAKTEEEAKAKGERWPRNFGHAMLLHQEKKRLEKLKEKQQG